MIISFSPQFRSDSLTLEKTGDRLRINGDLFNFNPLPEGGTIPAGEIPCEWIIGPVERIDGEVRLTLCLPYRVARLGTEAPPPMTIASDGPIALPELDPVITEESADVDA